MFFASADPFRSTVEVDPAWWLTHYDCRGVSDPYCNPFTNGRDGRNDYVHGFCQSIGSDPGSLYGALEREGEPCCFKVGGKIYTSGKFTPIDCGGGFYCMTYCFAQ